MTEHQWCEYRFVVKEWGDGDAYIYLDPCRGKLERLKGWGLFFDLVEGTTLKHAKEIAAYLNDNLGPLGLTGPGPTMVEESNTQH